MYELNLISHFRHMYDAARSIGTHAELLFDTLRVQVNGGDRYFEFEPEFLGVRGGKLFLSATLEPQTVAFTGWRHGPRKHWDLACDKRVFKDFCGRNDLRTPRVFPEPADLDTNVLIKEVRLPRLRGILRGPMPLRSVPAESFQPGAGLLVEEYVSGDIVRALYCEGELFAVECKKKPRVVGDGRSSVRDLIESVRQPVGELDWSIAAALCRLQGVSLDSVVPEGQEVVVDVGFRSVLQPYTTADQNILAQISGTPVHQQLQHAGPIFWLGIPENIRANAHFQLYAVIDAQQRAWFVEMDTDLHIDPHGYRPTLRKLFGMRPLPQMMTS